MGTRADGFDLGGLSTLDDVAEAASRLARAAAGGEITLEAAERCAGLLDLVRSSLESRDLEQRLVAVESHMKGADETW